MCGCGLERKASERTALTHSRAEARGETSTKLILDAGTASAQHHSNAGAVRCEEGAVRARLRLRRTTPLASIRADPGIRSDAEAIRAYDYRRICAELRDARAQEIR